MRMGNFQAIPPVIKNLLIVNALAFIATQVFGEDRVFNYFALHDVRSVFFKPHQIITHLFLHGDFFHILFNMFAVWMFGSILENLWGPKRFLTFYILCGIGAGLLHLGVLYMELGDVAEQFSRLPLEQQRELLYAEKFKMNTATVGASGAVFGCLTAFGYLFPNQMVYFYGFLPIKAKWFVIIYAAIELYLGIQNSAGDNVAHWAHLGGALVGFLLVLYWNKTNRRNFY